MGEIDFKKIAEQIKEINVIVSTCPDAVKERCFELLFNLIFRKRGEEENKPDADDAKNDSEQDKNSADEHKRFKLPSNVLQVARRYNISQADIEKVFLLEHDPLLPIYKITNNNMAAAQLQKILMVILQNGLLNNSLRASYVELRESCREDGLLEKNFNRNLKNRHELFKGAITASKIEEGGAVELTSDGLTKLSEVVHELAQAVG